MTYEKLYLDIKKICNMTSLAYGSLVRLAISLERKHTQNKKEEIGNKLSEPHYSRALNFLTFQHIHFQPPFLIPHQHPSEIG